MNDSNNVPFEKFIKESTWNYRLKYLCKLNPDFVTLPYKCENGKCDFSHVISWLPIYINNSYKTQDYESLEDQFNIAENLFKVVDFVDHNQEFFNPDKKRGIMLSDSKKFEQYFLENTTHKSQLDEYDDEIKVISIDSYRNKIDRYRNEIERRRIEIERRRIDAKKQYFVGSVLQYSFILTTFFGIIHNSCR